MKESTKLKISNSLKGNIPWNKGKKLSAEHIKNLSISHIGNKPTKESIAKRVSKMSGSRHPLWKGDKVGYYALHIWITRNWGKANKCQNKCLYPKKDARGKLMIRPKRYEWACITGIYNRDKKNWKMFCPSCHRKFDYKSNE